MPGLLLQGYYAILDVPGEAAPAPDELIARAQELLAARPCCLQLRGKRLPAGTLAAAAALVQPLCGAARVLFCVNDRVDVALAVGADLVHVGQDDLPLAETRRIAGDRLRVGVSTHSPAQARSAVADGADYIGFGPIFATRSKDRPDPVVGLEGLRAVARAVGDAVPVVAIGGIELDSVALVASAGARAAAVISAVDRAPDRTAAGCQVAAAFLPA